MSVVTNTLCGVEMLLVRQRNYRNTVGSEDTFNPSECHEKSPWLFHPPKRVGHRISGPGPEASTRKMTRHPAGRAIFFTRTSAISMNTWGMEIVLHMLKSTPAYIFIFI